MQADQESYALLTERLITVLRRTFGDQFAMYYNGGPDVIPNSAIPCVVVEKLTSDITAEGAATMTDDKIESAFIHVLVDGRKGFGTPVTQGDTVAAALERQVEDVDRTTGGYLPDTLMYAIRHNLTLDSTIIEHSEKVNYAGTPRKDQPTVREAIITVTAQSRILDPNRY